MVDGTVASSRARRDKHSSRYWRSARLCGSTASANFRLLTVKLSVKKDREFKQMKALGLLDNQLSLEQSLLATARLAKDKAPRLINELIAYLHLLITENHYHKNIPLVFDQAIETKKLIEKNNVNPEFALDILLSHCFSAGILPADLDLG